MLNRNAADNVRFIILAYNNAGHTKDSHQYENGANAPTNMTPAIAMINLCAYAGKNDIAIKSLLIKLD